MSEVEEWKMVVYAVALEAVEVEEIVWFSEAGWTRWLVQMKIALFHLTRNLLFPQTVTTKIRLMRVNLLFDEAEIIVIYL